MRTPHIVFKTAKRGGMLMKRMNAEVTGSTRPVVIGCATAERGSGTSRP